MTNAISYRFFGVGPLQPTRTSTTKAGPIFLIDASVFPGSSGSPVFHYRQGLSLDGAELSLTRSGVFLGLVASSMALKGARVVEQLPQRNGQIVRVEQMIDIGVVFKASTIIETMNASIGA